MVAITPASGNIGLAKSTVLNIVGQALPALLAFFTIPLIIRQLGADRFGILSFAWVILGNAVLFDVGMGKAATKFAAEAIGRGEQSRIPGIVGSTLWPQLVLGTIACALVTLSTGWLTESILNIPASNIEEARLTFLLIGAVIPVVLATTSYRGLLEAAQRFDLVNVFRVFFGSFTHLAPLIGIIFGWRLGGIMVLLAGSRLVQLIGMHWACARIFPGLGILPVFRLTEFRRMFSFGGWVAFSNVIAPIQNHLERMMLAALLPISALAYYSVPFEILTALCLVPASLAAPLSPLASILDAGNRGELIKVFRQSVRAIMVLMAFALFPIVTLADLLLGLWAGPELATASANVVRLLSIGIMATSLNLLAVSLFQGCGRPDIVVRQQILRLPIIGIASWLLISRFGLTGAAASWALGQTLTTTMYCWSIHRVLRWELTDISRQGAVALFSPLAVFVVLHGLAAFEDGSGALIRSLLTGFGMIVLAAVYWLYALTEGERRWIKNAFKSKWQTVREGISVYVAHRHHPLWTPKERRALFSQIKSAVGKELVLIRWFATARGNFILELQSPDDQARYFAKTHLNDRDSIAIEKNFNTLRCLNALSAPLDVKIPAPVALFRYSAGGRTQVVSVETGLAGVNTCEAQNLAASEKLNAVVAAWERMTSAWSVKRGVEDKVLDERMADARQNLLRHGLSDVPERALTQAVRYLRGAGWPQFVGPEHGDLSPGNILLQHESQVAVIDWSDMRPRGAPELDLVHLVLYSETHRKGTSLFEEWANLIEGSRPPAPLAARYGCSRLISAIGSVYWIHFVARSLGHVDDNWIRRHVDDGFERIRRQWELA